MCVRASWICSSHSSIIPSLRLGFRICEPDVCSCVCVTPCSLILVPRCAGVLLAPRHSPRDLRLLQHPGVSELIPAFQSEENIGVGKAARGEQMKLMAL